MAGILLAQATSSPTAPALVGQQILPSDPLFDILPNTSLELGPALLREHVILITLDSANLPSTGPWTLIETAADALSLLDIQNDESGLPALLLGATEHPFDLDGGPIEIRLNPQSGTPDLSVSLNGQFTGTISSAAALTLRGAESGVVRLQVSPISAPFVTPVAPAAVATITPASIYETVLSEFDCLKTYKQGQKVLKDDELVSFESVVDEKRGTFVALMSKGSRCIFLDWEQGADNNDGLGVLTTAGQSGRGPKKTWQAAMNSVQPGGVIVVTGGVYSYDPDTLIQPKDITLVPLGSVLLQPLTGEAAMLASGHLIRGKNGLEITQKYLEINNK